MTNGSSEVIAEYDRLATQYDRRWAGYIRATTEATAVRVRLQPGERFLDVGCGTGALLALLAQQVPSAILTGVDPSREMLAQARKRLPETIPLETAAAEHLPFPDATFDVVVSNSAFHYFAQPVVALREFNRVLRPGGRVVITDWCDDFLACRLCDRWLRWVDPAHTRMYGSQECQELLQTAGLVEVQIDRYKITWLWGLMTATARKQLVG